MATKKETSVAVAASDEQIAFLKEQFPTEQGFQRVALPRLGMYSQDQTEGKGKAMKVTIEAGTFYVEKKSEEADEEGKFSFVKEEIGSEIQATVVFQRKQLSMYDEETELFTSSPIYDNDEDVIPLWCAKAEVARATPKELKAMYPGPKADKKGNPTSLLKEKKILYVLYEGELYEMAVGGTSMYSFMGYARKTTPPAVLTRFNSEYNENGSISWNKMVFDTVRPLNADEIGEVIEYVKALKASVIAEKEYFSNLHEENEVAESGKARNLDELAADDDEAEFAGTKR